MDILYLGILIVLFILAIIDLNVGVSNDAVNFLNSAVGAKAASLKTVILIAVIGIFIGASTSNGMMDIARHGIFQPEHFYFRQLMCIFLAVVVTDVVLLDVFNSLGMPTSTTVSMVFELLGASFSIALVKVINEGNGMDIASLLNSSKALTVIIGIFLSVAIAFFFGMVVQWISRIIFTFNYKEKINGKIAIFGGIAVTAIIYFMLIKGMRDATFMTAAAKAWIDTNVGWLLLVCLGVCTALMQILHWCKVNVFKIIVLVGTFALAMAFAGNDLVNFIGVTLAAYSSFIDFTANGAGFTPDTYLMGHLNEPARTPIYFLVGAGAIMCFSLITSKKAHNVLKTSIDLARQDEGDEMFGSSSMARRIVRTSMGLVSGVTGVVPQKAKDWINRRFEQQDSMIRNGAAFDLVRASVNLVLAGLLIALGTSLKLPLSTTYVTFMVGMGSSLADRAWGRESAVFRITGVLSVIGGWFITAGAAFVIAGLVVLVLYFGGPIAMVLMITLAVFLLIRSHLAYRKKQAQETKDVEMDVILTSENETEVWETLRKHTAETLVHILDFAADTYGKMIDAFEKEDIKTLRGSLISIIEEKSWMKKMRRRETLGLRRVNKDIAFEKNTWYYLCSNNGQQILNTLNRICDPMKEHTDNNFKPLPEKYIEEFAPYKKRLLDVFHGISEIIRTGDYTEAEKISADGKWLKKEISNLRHLQTDRLQDDENSIKVAFVYLNLIQESHELLSEVRNVLRGSEKFFID